MKNSFSRIAYNLIARRNIIDRFNVVDSTELPELTRIRVRCRVDTLNISAAVGLVERVTGQRATVGPRKSIKKSMKWLDVYVDLRESLMYSFLDWFLLVTFLNYRGGWGNKTTPKSAHSMLFGSTGFRRIRALGGLVRISIVNENCVCVRLINLLPVMLRVASHLMSKELLLELDDLCIEIFINNIPTIDRSSIELELTSILSVLQLMR